LATPPLVVCYDLKEAEGASRELKDVR